jgi:integrase
MGLSPGTYKTYGVSMKLFLRFIEYRTPLQWLEMWNDAMESEGFDRKTILNRLAALRKCCKRMKELIPGYNDPFDMLSKKTWKKIFKKPAEQGVRAALTKEELNGLLEMLLKPNHWSRLMNYCIIYILASSGLRASELLSLRWGDLEIYEEDGETKVFANFYAKGGSRARHPMFLGAISSLAAWHDSVFGEISKDCHLIVNRNGEKMSYAALNMRVKRIAIEAKEKGVIRHNINLTCHTFRRSYITLLFKEGLDIRSIQRLSRHKVVNVLFEHYLDLNESPMPALSKIFKMDQDS